MANITKNYLHYVENGKKETIPTSNKFDKQNKQGRHYSSHLWTLLIIFIIFMFQVPILSIKIVPDKSNPTQLLHSSLSNQSKIIFSFKLTQEYPAEQLRLANCFVLITLYNVKLDLSPGYQCKLSSDMQQLKTGGLQFGVKALDPSEYVSVFTQESILYPSNLSSSEGNISTSGTNTPTSTVGIGSSSSSNNEGLKSQGTSFSTTFVCKIVEEVRYNVLGNKMYLELSFSKIIFDNFMLNLLSENEIGFLKTSDLTRSDVLARKYFVETIGIALSKTLPSKFLGPNSPSNTSTPRYNDQYYLTYYESVVNLGNNNIITETIFAGNIGFLESNYPHNKPVLLSKVTIENSTLKEKYVLNQVTLTSSNSASGPQVDSSQQVNCSTGDTSNSVYSSSSSINPQYLTPKNCDSGYLYRLFPTNKFSLSFDVEIHEFMYTKNSAIIVLQLPNNLQYSAFSPLLVQSSNVSPADSDKALGGNGLYLQPLREASLFEIYSYNKSSNSNNTKQSNIGQNAFILRNVSEDLLSGRKFKLTISNLLTKNEVGLIGELTLSVFWATTFSEIFSFTIFPNFSVEAYDIKFLNNPLSKQFWSGVSHNEFFDIYENAAWPLRFSFTLPDLKDDMFLVIRHVSVGRSNLSSSNSTNNNTSNTSNSNTSSVVQNAVNFLTSTCDFSETKSKFVTSSSSTSNSISNFLIRNDLSTSSASSGSSDSSSTTNSGGTSAPNQNQATNFNSLFVSEKTIFNERTKCFPLNSKNTISTNSAALSTTTSSSSNSSSTSNLSSFFSFYDDGVIFKLPSIINKAATGVDSNDLEKHNISLLIWTTILKCSSNNIAKNVVYNVLDSSNTEANGVALNFEYRLYSKLFTINAKDTTEYKLKYVFDDRFLVGVSHEPVLLTNCFPSVVNHPSNLTNTLNTRLFYFSGNDYIGASKDVLLFTELYDWGITSKSEQFVNFISGNGEMDLIELSQVREISQSSGSSGRNIGSSSENTAGGTGNTLFSTIDFEFGMRPNVENTKTEDLLRNPTPFYVSDFNKTTLSDFIFTTPDSTTEEDSVANAIKSVTFTQYPGTLSLQVTRNIMKKRISSQVSQGCYLKWYTDTQTDTSSSSNSDNMLYYDGSTTTSSNPSSNFKINTDTSNFLITEDEPSFYYNDFSVFQQPLSLNSYTINSSSSSSTPSSSFESPVFFRDPHSAFSLGFYTNCFHWDFTALSNIKSVSSFYIDITYMFERLVPTSGNQAAFTRTRVGRFIKLLPSLFSTASLFSKYIANGNEITSTTPSDFEKYLSSATAAISSLTRLLPVNTNTQLSNTKSGLCLLQLHPAILDGGEAMRFYTSSPTTANSDGSNNNSISNYFIGSRHVLLSLTGMTLLPEDVRVTAARHPIYPAAHNLLINELGSPDAGYNSNSNSAVNSELLFFDITAKGFSSTSLAGDLHESDLVTNMQQHRASLNAQNSSTNDNTYISLFSEFQLFSPYFPQNSLQGSSDPSKDATTLLSALKYSIIPNLLSSKTEQPKSTYAEYTSLVESTTYHITETQILLTKEFVIRASESNDTSTLTPLINYNSDYSYSNNSSDVKSLLIPMQCAFASFSSLLNSDLLPSTKDASAIRFVSSLHSTPPITLTAVGFGYKYLVNNPLPLVCSSQALLFAKAVSSVSANTQNSTNIVSYCDTLVWSNKNYKQDIGFLGGGSGGSGTTFDIGSSTRVNMSVAAIDTKSLNSIVFSNADTSSGSGSQDAMLGFVRVLRSQADSVNGIYSLFGNLVAFVASQSSSSGFVPQQNVSTDSLLLATNSLYSVKNLFSSDYKTQSSPDLYNNLLRNKLFVDFSAFFKKINSNSNGGNGSSGSNAISTPSIDLYEPVVSIFTANHSSCATSNHEDNSTVNLKDPRLQDYGNTAKYFSALNSVVSDLLSKNGSSFTLLTAEQLMSSFPLFSESLISSIGNLKVGTNEADDVNSILSNGGIQCLPSSNSLNSSLAAFILNYSTPNVDLSSLANLSNSSQLTWFMQNVFSSNVTYPSFGVSSNVLYKARVFNNFHVCVARTLLSIITPASSRQGISKILTITNEFPLFYFSNLIRPSLSTLSSYIASLETSGGECLSKTSAFMKDSVLMNIDVQTSNIISSPVFSFSTKPDVAMDSNVVNEGLVVQAFDSTFYNDYLLTGLITTFNSDSLGTSGSSSSSSGVYLTQTEKDIFTANSLSNWAVSVNRLSTLPGNFMYLKNDSGLSILITIRFNNTTISNNPGTSGSTSFATAQTISYTTGTLSVYFQSKPFPNQSNSNSSNNSNNTNTNTASYLSSNDQLLPFLKHSLILESPNFLPNHTQCLISLSNQTVISLILNTLQLTSSINSSLSSLSSAAISTLNTSVSNTLLSILPKSVSFNCGDVVASSTTCSLDKVNAFLNETLGLVLNNDILAVMLGQNQHNPAMFSTVLFYFSEMQVHCHNLSNKPQEVVFGAGTGIYNDIFCVSHAAYAPSGLVPGQLNSGFFPLKSPQKTVNSMGSVISETIELDKLEFIPKITEVVFLGLAGNALSELMEGLGYDATFISNSLSQSSVLSQWLDGYQLDVLEFSIDLKRPIVLNQRVSILTNLESVLPSSVVLAFSGDIVNQPQNSSSSTTYDQNYTSGSVYTSSLKELTSLKEVKCFVSTTKISTQTMKNGNDNAAFAKNMESNTNTNVNDSTNPYANIFANNELVRECVLIKLSPYEISYQTSQSFSINTQPASHLLQISFSDSNNDSFVGSTGELTISNISQIYVYIFPVFLSTIHNSSGPNTTASGDSTNSNSSNSSFLSVLSMLKSQTYSIISSFNSIPVTLQTFNSLINYFYTNPKPQLFDYKLSASILVPNTNSTNLNPSVNIEDPNFLETQVIDFLLCGVSPYFPLPNSQNNTNTAFYNSKINYLNVNPDTLPDFLQANSTTTNINNPNKASIPSPLTTGLCDIDSVNPFFIPNMPSTLVFNVNFYHDSLMNLILSTDSSSSGNVEVNEITIYLSRDLFYPAYNGEDLNSSSIQDTILTTNSEGVSFTNAYNNLFNLNDSDLSSELYCEIELFSVMQVPCYWEQTGFLNIKLLTPITTETINSLKSELPNTAISNLLRRNLYVHGIVANPYTLFFRNRQYSPSNSTNSTTTTNMNSQSQDTLLLKAFPCSINFFSKNSSQRTSLISGSGSLFLTSDNTRFIHSLYSYNSKLQKGNILFLSSDPQQTTWYIPRSTFPIVIDPKDSSYISSFVKDQVLSNNIVYNSVFTKPTQYYQIVDVNFILQRNSYLLNSQFTQNQQNSFSQTFFITGRTADDTPVFYVELPEEFGQFNYLNLNTDNFNNTTDTTSTSSNPDNPNSTRNFSGSNAAYNLNINLLERFIPKISLVYFGETASTRQTLSEENLQLRSLTVISKHPKIILKILLKYANINITSNVHYLNLKLFTNESNITPNTELNSGLINIVLMDSSTAPTQMFSTYTNTNNFNTSKSSAQSNASNDLFPDLNANSGSSSISYPLSLQTSVSSSPNSWSILNFAKGVSFKFQAPLYFDTLSYLLALQEQDVISGFGINVNVGEVQYSLKRQYLFSVPKHKIDFINLFGRDEQSNSYTLKSQKFLNSQTLYQQTIPSSVSNFGIYNSLIIYPGRYNFIQAVLNSPPYTNSESTAANVSKNSLLNSSSVVIFLETPNYNPFVFKLKEGLVALNTSSQSSVVLQLGTPCLAQQGVYVMKFSFLLSQNNLVESSTEYSETADAEHTRQSQIKSMLLSKFAELPILRVSVQPSLRNKEVLYLSLENKYIFDVGSNGQNLGPQAASNFWYWFSLPFGGRLRFFLHSLHAPVEDVEVRVSNFYLQMLGVLASATSSFSSSNNSTNSTMATEVLNTYNFQESYFNTSSIAINKTLNDAVFGVNDDVNVKSRLDFIVRAIDNASNLANAKIVETKFSGSYQEPYPSSDFAVFNLNPGRFSSSFEVVSYLQYKVLKKSNNPSMSNSSTMSNSTQPPFIEGDFVYFGDYPTNQSLKQEIIQKLPPQASLSVFLSSKNKCFGFNSTMSSTSQQTTNQISTVKTITDLLLSINKNSSRISDISAVDLQDMFYYQINTQKSVINEVNSSNSFISQLNNTQMNSIELRLLTPLKNVYIYCNLVCNDLVQYNLLQKKNSYLNYNFTNNSNVDFSDFYYYNYLFNNYDNTLVKSLIPDSTNSSLLNNFNRSNYDYEQSFYAFFYDQSTVGVNTSQVSGILTPDYSVGNLNYNLKPSNLSNYFISFSELLRYSEYKLQCLVSDNSFNVNSTKTDTIDVFINDYSDHTSALKTPELSAPANYTHYLVFNFSSHPGLEVFKSLIRIFQQEVMEGIPYSHDLAISDNSIDERNKIMQPQSSTTVNTATTNDLTSIGSKCIADFQCLAAYSSIVNESTDQLPTSKSPNFYTQDVIVSDSFGFITPGFNTFNSTFYYINAYLENQGLATNPIDKDINVIDYTSISLNARINSSSISTFESNKNQQFSLNSKIDFSGLSKVTTQNDYGEFYKQRKRIQEAIDVVNSEYNINNYLNFEVNLSKANANASTAGVNSYLFNTTGDSEMEISNWGVGNLIEIFSGSIEDIIKRMELSQLNTTAQTLASSRRMRNLNDLYSTSLLEKSADGESNVLLLLVQNKSNPNKSETQLDIEHASGNNKKSTVRELQTANNSSISSTSNGTSKNTNSNAKNTTNSTSNASVSSGNSAVSRINQTIYSISFTENPKSRYFSRLNDLLNKLAVQYTDIQTLNNKLLDYNQFVNNSYQIKHYTEKNYLSEIDSDLSVSLSYSKPNLIVRTKFSRDVICHWRLQRVASLDDTRYRFLTDDLTLQIVKSQVLECVDYYNLLTVGNSNPSSGTNCGSILIRNITIDNYLPLSLYSVGNYTINSYCENPEIPNSKSSFAFIMGNIVVMEDSLSNSSSTLSNNSSVCVKNCLGFRLDFNLFNSFILGLIVMQIIN